MAQGDIDGIRHALEAHAEHRVSDAEFRGAVSARLDHIEGRFKFWYGISGALAVAAVSAILAAMWQAVGK